MTASTEAHAAHRPSAAPSVVLDTNAVLDWLVFRHPACVDWTSRLANESVHWLASEAMKEELQQVLARGIDSAPRPDLPVVWAAWSRFACAAEPRSLAGPASRLRCTDLDDQKFVDLALAHEARWLVSRDRAVLKLARRAIPLGLRILTPEAWTAELASP